MRVCVPQAAARLERHERPARRTAPHGLAALPLVPKTCSSTVSALSCVSDTRTCVFLRTNTPSSSRGSRSATATDRVAKPPHS